MGGKVFMDHLVVTQGNSAPADLSAEIIRMVEKRPGDLVTCRWLFDDHYRCNWWAPSSSGDYDNPSMPGLMVTTHRVRLSRFLTVTRTAAGLVLSHDDETARDQ